MPKPKHAPPTFSLFFEGEPQVEWLGPLDQVTGLSGGLHRWGDGIFSYGVWSFNDLENVADSHFSLHEIDRKVFVSRDLRDLLVLEAQKLNQENTYLSESDYETYKNFKTLQEKVLWLLLGDPYSSSEAYLGPFYNRIKKVCQYASRGDVLVLHAENLSHANDDCFEAAIEKLQDFLFLHFEGHLSSLDFYPKEEIGIYKQVFTEEIAHLFTKRFGHYQNRLGY